MDIPQFIPVQRADGITAAERYLKKLCDSTFLSLWSYPGVFRDEGGGSKKEVCDLLVVFGNHILIFSDKDCVFRNTGNLDVDWNRWYRKAILKSAKQLWGAEAWIRAHPDNLYIDNACTQPLPIALPDPSEAVFHRILVAHGVAERCRLEPGGGNGLKIIPDIIGEAHQASRQDNGLPLAIGQVAPEKGYLHVFDDSALNTVLATLNTVTDFVTYLARKEALINGGHLIMAATEQDLLALYLSRINDQEEHDFILPADGSKLFVDAGTWEQFSHAPQRRAQLEEDRISYLWDRLIENHNQHIMAGTQHFSTDVSIREQEKIMRHLARETRLRRRMLAMSILEINERTPSHRRGVRVMAPSRPGEPYYVFVLLPRTPDESEEEYRQNRRTILEAYLQVTKLTYPDALDVVGVATETGLSPDRAHSTDLALFEAEQWSQEAEEEARRLQDEFGFLKTTEKSHRLVREYPQ